jgi:hypothetical protein
MWNFIEREGDIRVGMDKYIVIVFNKEPQEYSLRSKEGFILPHLTFEVADVDPEYNDLGNLKFVRKVATNLVLHDGMDTGGAQFINTKTKKDVNVLKVDIKKIKSCIVSEISKSVERSSLTIPFQNNDGLNLEGIVTEDRTSSEKQSVESKAVKVTEIVIN